MLVVDGAMSNRMLVSVLGGHWVKDTIEWLETDGTKEVGT